MKLLFKQKTCIKKMYLIFHSIKNNNEMKKVKIKDEKKMFKSQNKCNFSFHSFLVFYQKLIGEQFHSINNSNQLKIKDKQEKVKR